MRKGGLLVFTVEALDVGLNRDFELGGSGRYRHDAAYVQQVVKAVGLGIRRVERAVLRKELGEPVAGFVVTAAKA